MASKDWNRGGSFMQKPSTGWLHNDADLTHGDGIFYPVQYVGKIGMAVSMRTMRFEDRTNVTREAITLCCEAAGFKDKQQRSPPSIVKRALVEDAQVMKMNVRFTVSTTGVSLIVVETNEIIANHIMPNISFATGNQSTNYDYIAYVAKDSRNKRECHVFYCGDVAPDVMATLGQAFELRFKAFLAKTERKAAAPPARGPARGPVYDTAGPGSGAPPPQAVYDDVQGVYGGGQQGQYNDVYGDHPPSQGYNDFGPGSSSGGGQYDDVSGIYDSGSSGQYNDVKPSYDTRPGGANQPVYDTAATGAEDSYFEVQSNYDHGTYGGGTYGSGTYGSEGTYGEVRNQGNYGDGTYGSGNYGSNYGDIQVRQGSVYGDGPGESAYGDVPQGDTNDSGRFASSQLAKAPNPELSRLISEEMWFHGNIERAQADSLLREEGNFLVRESRSPGQYILSALQRGEKKHLLLVDPSGQVRTNDLVFNDVSHLINYHINARVPVISRGLQISLGRPVPKGAV